MQGIETPGRQLLHEWMAADPKRTQSFIGKKLGVSQPGVGAWVRGVSRPDRRFRDALLALCGIPVEAWDTAEERAAHDELMQRAAEQPEERSATGTDGGAT